MCKSLGVFPVAEDTDLAAVNLCGVLIVFDCPLYNQGMFGTDIQGHTSRFCCCKPLVPRYKEYLVKMFKRGKEGG